MRFFSKQAIARCKTPAGATDWDKVWSDYKSHLESVRGHLSQGWQRLAVEELHDCKILSTHRPSKRVFDIVLSGFILKFTGVSFLWIPESIIGDYWIYWEVTPSERGGVSLEVRLVENEIRIIAEEVEICSGHRP